MNNPTVFLSYANARPDRDFARRLALELKEKGFDIWDDKRVMAGDDWEDILRTTLHEASAFVLVLSPDWSKGPRTAFEYGAAEVFGKKIIPVLITNSGWNVPPMFQKKAYIDATKLSKDQVATMIAAAIQN